MVHPRLPLPQILIQLIPRPKHPPPVIPIPYIIPIVQIPFSCYFFSLAVPLAPKPIPTINATIDPNELPRPFISIFRKIAFISISIYLYQFSLASALALGPFTGVLENWAIEGA